MNILTCLLLLFQSVAMNRKIHIYLEIRIIWQTNQFLQTNMNSEKDNKKHYHLTKYIATRSK